jgi:hypothetical protein
MAMPEPVTLDLLQKMVQRVLDSQNMLRRDNQNLRSRMARIDHRLSHIDHRLDHIEHTLLAFPAGRY